MLTIYLVPVGETDLSPHLELLGLNNPVLNSDGIRHAEETARKLGSVVLEAVFSGTMKREVVTARRIAKPHDIPIRIDKRLKDINYGSWSGLTWEAIETRDFKLFDKLKRSTRFRFPSGEKLKKVWRRVLIFTNSMKVNFGTGSIVIVAEDFISSIITSQLTGLDLLGLEPWIPRGEMMILECDLGKCTLKSYRGTAK